MPGSIVRRGANLMARLADTGKRLFGVVDRHYRPSPFDFARLSQMFGPDSIELPSIGTVVREVNVVWEKLKGGPAPKAQATPLQIKRNGVWGNGLLIRRVTRLARAIQRGDQAAIEQSFPVVAEHLDLGSPRRVAILVEGLSQAERLAHKLPEWQIITHDSETFQRESEFEAGIVTGLGTEKIPTELIDVLLRVDCGPGLPPLPSDWLETGHKALRPLLLVDFDLANHPQLRRWSRERRDEYRRVGWPDLAEDPDIATYRRFRQLTGRKRR